MGKTLDYYNSHYDAFTSDTASLGMIDCWKRFERALKDSFPDTSKEDIHILDLGCGSGRDTRHFLSEGYAVSAADGSSELCRIARENTGITVREMDFLDLNVHEAYQGIWACASILHLQATDLVMMFHKISDALTSSGVLYVSFKYGDFTGYRNERYYTDLTEDSLSELVTYTPKLQIKEMWQSGDVRPGRGEEKWINALIWKI